MEVVKRSADEVRASEGDGPEPHRVDFTCPECGHEVFVVVRLFDGPRPDVPTSTWRRSFGWVWHRWARRVKGLSRPKILWTERAAVVGPGIEHEDWRLIAFGIYHMRYRMLHRHGIAWPSVEAYEERGAG